MLILNYLNTLGQYLILMGRSFSRPERMRMFLSATLRRCHSLASTRWALCCSSLSSSEQLSAYR